jgi:enoyl-[acyl-carrier protein] reductase II
MAVSTPLSQRLGMQYPIIQAGMSWASSNVALPAAVSNAGGLGILAAGPMRPDDLRAALAQLRDATDRPWGVNVPLYRKGVEEILDIVAEAKPAVVIASQGAPGDHLKRFHDLGSLWLHVTALAKHAEKAAAQGVDGVIVVGTEAGGHPPDNGVSTLVAVRRILGMVDCPVIAGGGVADGYGIAALLALGADAVQLGTRFLMTREAGVHDNYKHAVAKADIVDTVLAGRGNLPVRCVSNDFTASVLAAEAAGLPTIDPDGWKQLLSGATLRQAALHGDVAMGKIEAGQSAGLIADIPPAADVMTRLVEEMEAAIKRLSDFTQSIPVRREFA